MASKYLAFAAALFAMCANSQVPDKLPPAYTIFAPATGRDFMTHDNLYEVYRSAKEFVSRWPRNDTCDDSCVRRIARSIDFKRQMLIIIAPRDRGQVTYDVHVYDVVTSETSLDVTFLELRHGQSEGQLLCGLLMVMPMPSVALLVPQSSNPVRFFRKRADVLCEEPVLVQ